MPELASDRLGVAYRQAIWLILLVMVIAGIMVVAALIHISRSISAPLLHLADRMRRLAANDTEIDISGTERRDEIGEMAQATVVFRNNAIELMRSQRTLARRRRCSRSNWRRNSGSRCCSEISCPWRRTNSARRSPSSMAMPGASTRPGKRCRRPKSANAPEKFAPRCCA